MFGPKVSPAWRRLRALWCAGLLVFAGLLFLPADASAQALQAIPALDSHVVDRTASLTEEQRRQLESRLAAFEQEKGAQVVVLIVPSVQPEDIAAYGMRVVEAWKLGRSKVDDGVLLLVAKEDRTLRIEVGYGLEGALNDATAKRIIEERIVPKLRAGDFYGGIDAGVSAILAVVQGEALPPPARRASAAGGQSDWFDSNLLLFAAVAISVVGGVLRSIFGRFLGAGIVGGVIGAIAFALSSALFPSLGAGVVAFVFALLMGSGRGGGGFGGGGFGGGRRGGGGGFGGGGFSGGGGGFGGGGASGRW